MVTWYIRVSLVPNFCHTRRPSSLWKGRKEGNVLFNDTLNTFYLRLYGIRHMVKDHSDRQEETCCRHIGYSFRLAARVLLYASSHRQDNTYHSLCYISCGALAGMRNSSMGSQWRIDPTTHRTMNERSYHGATLWNKYTKIHSFPQSNNRDATQNFPKYLNILFILPSPSQPWWGLQK